MLVPHADSVILVTRPFYSRSRLVRLALDMLYQRQAKNVNITGEPRPGRRTWRGIKPCWERSVRDRPQSLRIAGQVFELPTAFDFCGRPFAHELDHSESDYDPQQSRRFPP